MKKKILSLCLVAVLALAAVGGTLAYFTDTDEATNAFIIGSVNGSGKVGVNVDEEFTQNSGLLPGSPVNKDVAILTDANTEDSYVWYEYLIPTALDDSDGTDDILTVAFADGTTYPAEATTDALKATGTWGTATFVETETVDGIKYNKYVVKFSAIVKAGQYTPYSMDSVTLSTAVDFNGTNYTYNGEVINFTFTNGVKIIVRGYAIQSASFNSFDEAFTAYYQQNSTN